MRLQEAEYGLHYRRATKCKPYRCIKYPSYPWLKGGEVLQQAAFYPVVGTDGESEATGTADERHANGVQLLKDP